MRTSRNTAIREIQALDLPRKVVAHVTSASWKSVPHVTYLYEPDITNFHIAFENLAAARSERTTGAGKLSFNTILIKAIVQGLLAAPKLNSLFEYNARTAEGRLQVCSDINISLPWLVRDGRMIAPIIARANEMSLDDISDFVAALADRIERTNIDELIFELAYAKMVEEFGSLRFGMIPRVLSSVFGRGRPARLRGKERETYYRQPESLRLTKKDILGGTVTVSNVGALYREQQGHFGLLEVIPPQVLAVGVSAIQEKPGIFMDRDRNQQIGIRKFLPICLAFDHRAIDFDALVPFLRRMDEIFARPAEEILAW